MIFFIYFFIFFLGGGRGVFLSTVVRGRHSRTSRMSWRFAESVRHAKNIL